MLGIHKPHSLFFTFFFPFKFKNYLCCFLWKKENESYWLLNRKLTLVGTTSGTKAAHKLQAVQTQLILKPDFRPLSWTKFVQITTAAALNSSTTCNSALDWSVQCDTCNSPLGNCMWTLCPWPQSHADCKKTEQKTGRNTKKATFVAQGIIKLTANIDDEILKLSSAVASCVCVLHRMLFPEGDLYRWLESYRGPFAYHTHTNEVMSI